MNQIFEIKNLVYQYPKAPSPTIQSISFAVTEGTIFGLLGPSGAGKSTTQRILSKLLSNYQGTIMYCGKNLKEYKKDYYEDIGVGFEMPVHFGKLTGRENLIYFASFYKKNIDYLALMERVGLSEALDQEVNQYSKGMKVRLNFVRALLNDPKVLFLDEPTAGLDPNNSKIIKTMIKEFRERGTVIITTHLMGDVEELCDQVVFMHKGIVSEAASPRNLKLEYGQKEIQVEYLENNQVVSKVFPLDKIATNEDFHHCLEKDIQTIHTGETTLDDIFIKITGGTVDDATRKTH